MSLTEKTLARLAEWPLNAAYRTLIGFVFFPLYIHLFGPTTSFWRLSLFLLAVLVLLRLVPAVLRHLLPFSGEVKAMWKEQRQLAKRYDSFQWQKLFWIGLGLTAYLPLGGGFSPPQLTLAGVCLVSGALGLWVWSKSARPQCH